MKSIRTFIEGKIRRSESEGVLVLDAAGAAHPVLGADEGVLAGPNGRLVFYEHGMVLEGGDEVRYEDIERVHIQPPRAGDDRLIDVILREGAVKRLTTSAAGAVVVHATLRWIGHTRLRRDIAPDG